MKKYQASLIIMVMMLFGLALFYQNCSQQPNSGIQDASSFGDTNNNQPGVAKIIVTTKSNCQELSCNGSCSFQKTDVLYVCIYKMGTNPIIYRSSNVVPNASEQVGASTGWTQGADSWAKVFYGTTNGFTVAGSYTLTVQSPGYASVSTSFTINP